MNKNKTMKLVLLFLSLAGIGYAACQYCKSDSSDGTTSNCSSACVKTRMFQLTSIVKTHRTHCGVLSGMHTIAG